MRFFSCSFVDGGHFHFATIAMAMCPVPIWPLIMKRPFALLGGDKGLVPSSDALCY